MRVAEVLVRFYRAFNYDYMRKFHDRGSALPWELLPDGAWYPFVSVPLAHDITTIVGANESGKSQILAALKIALTGDGAARRDFCRYSRFFLVDEPMRLSDFGVTVTDLSEEERLAVSKLCGVDADALAPEVTVVRSGNKTTSVWHRTSDAWAEAKLPAASVTKLNALLPKPFEMRSDLPLPDQVPLEFLADPRAAARAEPLHTRQARQGVLASFFKLGSAIFVSPEQVTASAPKIAAAFNDTSTATRATSADEIKLASDLLVKIAGIGPEHFADLLQAVAEGRDGYVNGVQEQINKALASHLNFRKWWTQDSSFQLRVSIRESDLAFIIRDRTGTDYSFGERSGGLKYFLSYFVQYLAHDEPESGSEILLMDEPDAFLSSQGQRDLLRIFDALAYPEDGRRPCSVVYVTHSPFLLDKNHSERIRVLEKGEGDEGTRVVRDAAQNHYEPLRSAFGGFVAETTFMGSCNLMIEGPADQVLLAGLSTWLRRSGAASTEFLDLNSVTLVPASGASHIPYLVYLARGRDVEKPAVIVLLDGDKAGAEARRQIQRGGAYKKALVAEALVAQISDDRFSFQTDRLGGPIDIEDLIPREIAVVAGQRYTAEFIDADASLEINPSVVDCSNGVREGVESALRTALSDPDLTLDKVGFARHVLSVVGALKVSDEAISTLRANFIALFTALGVMQRQAMAEHAEIRTSERVSRATGAFLDDHKARAAKSDVQILFEQITYSLDASRESEDTRSEMRRLADIHSLDVDPGSDVTDFDSLRHDLAALALLARKNSQIDVPLTSSPTP